MVVCFPTPEESPGGQPLRSGSTQLNRRSADFRRPSDLLSLTGFSRSQSRRDYWERPALLGKKRVYGRRLRAKARAVRQNNLV